MKQTIFWVILVLIVPFVSAYCIDNPDANIYTGNSGEYGYNTGDGLIMNSNCINDYRIAFTYCQSGNVDFIMHTCPCSEGKCIARTFDVPYWIKHWGESDSSLREGWVSEKFTRSAIDNWIND